MDYDVWKARFEDWLELSFPSRDTRRNYLFGLAPFLEFIRALGFASWTEVTRDVLEEYRAHVFSRKTEKGQALKVGTHVARLMAVKTFFRFLVSEGFLLANPASRLELPKRRVPLPNVLSEAEILRLMEVPDTSTFFGIRDRTLLEILYGTALRNKEVCSLTLDQVDLSQHLVRLQQGKGDKGRVVPLGQEAQSWLELYLETVRPKMLRDPAVMALFLNRWGHGALERSTLSKVVRDLGREAEIGKVVTPHILRHSCATHMLRRGAGLRQIQRLLGHEQLSSTEHYTRVEVSDLRRLLSRCHPRERRHSKQ